MVIGFPKGISDGINGGIYKGDFGGVLRGVLGGPSGFQRGTWRSRAFYGVFRGLQGDPMSFRGVSKNPRGFLRSSRGFQMRFRRYQENCEAFKGGFKVLGSYQTVSWSSFLELSGRTGGFSSVHREYRRTLKPLIYP